jgi:hypothetical protein
LSVAGPFEGSSFITLFGKTDQVTPRDKFEAIIDAIVGDLTDAVTRLNWKKIRRGATIALMVGGTLVAFGVVPGGAVLTKTAGVPVTVSSVLWAATDATGLAKEFAEWVSTTEPMISLRAEIQRLESEDAAARESAEREAAEQRASEATREIIRKRAAARQAALAEEAKTQPKTLRAKAGGS